MTTPLHAAHPASTPSVADEIDRIYADDQTEVPGRIFLHNIARETRSVVMRNVFFNSDPRWLSAFVVMLVLSAAVATLGLSQDSAATVIGSMIIAPLGAPIIGLGGAIVSAWPRQTFRLLLIVMWSAAAVVAVAYVLGLVLPNGTPTAQILARTDPDLRDLGVAAFAGAAGGYSMTRPSLSSSLVGVAIAVALIPPLAAVGLMLEEQHWKLAQGAITLFAANFVGITFAAGAVLLATGFVPMPRLVKRTPVLVAGFAASIAVAAVVIVPLAASYRAAMRTATTQTSTYRQVAATVAASNSGVDIGKIDINGDLVTINVDNPTAVPAAAQFEADLIDELGPNVSVIVK